MSAILKVDNVSKSFGGIKAVQNVSFQVPKGMLYGIIGPNGAGKSTLFNLLTNLYTPDQGSVYFLEKKISSMSPHKIAKLGVARTFQTAKVFPHLTVLENTLVGGYRLCTAKLWHQSFWLKSTRNDERMLCERATQLLELVGLGNRLSELSQVLAPAERKRLELARVLMMNPDILLLDEPAAGMNDSETAALAHLIQAIQSVGITVLVVEHNMSLIMGIAEMIMVLDAGKVIDINKPEAVQKNPKVIEAYFGKERM